MSFPGHDIDGWAGDTALREYIRVTQADGSQVYLSEWLAQRGEELGGEELVGRPVCIFWFDQPLNGRRGAWFKATVQGKP